MLTEGKVLTVRLKEVCKKPRNLSSKSLHLVHSMKMEGSITIFIPGSLPDLNRFIKALNNNRFGGAQMKKEADEIVILFSKKHRNHGLTAPFFVEFEWHCKDKKIDKDNIAFAKKFILDGLQKAEVLPQDSWKGVDGFSDRFFLDKENPHIVVRIKQA